MINTITQALKLSERLFVSAILLAIVLIAGTDVILRLFLSEGLSWAAPFLKISLLWVSLFGAILAAGSNDHIRIDVLEHYLPAKYSPMLQKAVKAFSAGVCFFIAYHAYRFVAETYAYEDMIFANIPAWIAQAIIPFSFALIGLRFGIQALFTQQEDKSEIEP